jgi:hypothetical protein
MISDIELHRILDAQPLPRMRFFASLLGWNDLQLEYVRLPEDEAQRGSVCGCVVIFYMTTDPKFNLQINTYPHGQCRHHRATVKADRYGIINVGWHDFQLCEDDTRLCADVERLTPWLRRDQFKDRAWRREFIAKHPEFAYPQSQRRR